MKKGDKERLLKLSKKMGSSVWASGAYFNDDLGRLVQFWRRSHSHPLKKHCNRKFRYYNDDFRGKSNIHKKRTEYWWELD